MTAKKSDIYGNSTWILQKSSGFDRQFTLIDTFRAGFGGYSRRKSPPGSRAERRAYSVSTDFVAPASSRHLSRQDGGATNFLSPSRFCGCNRPPVHLSSCACDRRFYFLSSGARIEVRIDQSNRLARITGWRNEKPDPICLGWNHHHHAVWGTSRSSTNLQLDAAAGGAGGRLGPVGD